MSKAVVWDFDGTLADTSVKNFNVTKKIINELCGNKSKEFEALRTLSSYILANQKAKNWRELYRIEFNFSAQLIDEAGRLWTDFQLKDDTEVTLYDGIENAVQALSDYPQMIFSQNARANIVRFLNDKNLAKYFTDVIGYEEVPFDKQKPAPDGLLLCIEKLNGFAADKIFFIGDHETDILCGYNANREIKRKGKHIQLINLALLNDSNNVAHLWGIRPDVVVKNAVELINLIND